MDHVLQHHRRRPGAALRGLLGAEEKPADPEDVEAMRYAPQPPRRFRWLRAVVAVAAVVLVGWAGLNLANGWVRDQYYVAASSGQVAIYQGVSQEIGPIRLSELYEVPGGLPVDALPDIYRQQVGETIAAEDLKDAQDVVESLRVNACRAHERLDPSPRPTTPAPTRTPSGTASPTGNPQANDGSGSGTGQGGQNEQQQNEQGQGGTNQNETNQDQPGRNETNPDPDAGRTGGWLGDDVGFPGLLCASAP